MKVATPGNSPNPRMCSWIILSTLAMIAVPAAITLHTVRYPAKPQVPLNPTAYDYSCSLLLFILPLW